MIPYKEAISNKSRLVYVRYKDHVEFRNADPSLLGESVREVVGWLVRETDEAICLCCERAVKPIPFEKPSESGFIILKSDVLEIRKIIEAEKEPGSKKG